MLIRGRYYKFIFFLLLFISFSKNEINIYMNIYMNEHFRDLHSIIRGTGF